MSFSCFVPCITKLTLGRRFLLRADLEGGSQYYEGPWYETDSRAYQDGTSSLSFFLTMPSQETPETMANHGVAILTQHQI